MSRHPNAAGVLFDAPITVTARAPSAGSSARSGWLIDGRYRVTECLGRGGMADVFCAHDESLDRDVAVKVFAGGEELQRRANQEIRIAAGLHHRNLIKILDAGVDRASPARPVSYLVMELIDGPTVAERIANDPLDATEVAELGMQVAAALSHIHARRIVHRDVKPANVLLADQGQHGPWTAKLADLGIAWIADGAALTMAGATIGTASYLSPEQALGGQVGPPSDVYSLGLVLLEALTGHRAYDGAADIALARIGPAPQIPAELGPDWVHLLTAMTASDPASRPTASDVVSMLQRIAAGQTMPLRASFDVLFGAGAEPESTPDMSGVGTPIAEPTAPLSTATATRWRPRLGWAMLLTLSIPAVMAVSMLMVQAISPSHRHATVPSRPVITHPAAPSIARSQAVLRPPAPVLGNSTPATTTPTQPPPLSAAPIMARLSTAPAARPAAGTRASTSAKPAPRTTTANHSSPPTSPSSTAPPSTTPSASSGATGSNSTAQSSAATFASASPTASPPSTVPATGSPSGSAVATSPPKSPSATPPPSTPPSAPSGATGSNTTAQSSAATSASASPTASPPSSAPASGSPSGSPVATSP